MHLSALETHFPTKLRLCEEQEVGYYRSYCQLFCVWRETETYSPFSPGISEIKNFFRQQKETDIREEIDSVLISNFTHIFTCISVKYSI